MTDKHTPTPQFQVYRLDPDRRHVLTTADPMEAERACECMSPMGEVWVEDRPIYSYRPKGGGHRRHGTLPTEWAKARAALALGEGS